MLAEYYHRKMSACGLKLPCAPSKTYCATMNTPITALSVNQKLRDVRRSKSLSLRDVEILSNATIKAVVLGSYERGARTLSVKRVIALANLYEIPVSELFGGLSQTVPRQVPKLLLDLRLLRLRAANSDHHFNGSYQNLLPLLEKIVYARQDWNGEVISLRESDIHVIALLLKMSEKDALTWITTESILLQRKN